jgi:oligoendopeptidase F
MELLAAGGSEAPSDLLARLGIDLRDPTVWGRGVGGLKRLLSDAERLADSV